MIGGSAAELDDEILVVQSSEYVRVLLLNRPTVHNAINLELALQIGDALTAADEDPEVRAVVLGSATERMFCAGADLTELAAGRSVTPTEPPHGDYGFAGVVRHPISKPLIAAISGAALGGGTEIALACDLVVAEDGAVLGLPEVKCGLIAGAGGAFRLGWQIPQKIALEILLTGAPIDAGRALELGLVNRVVPVDRGLDAAISLARTIAANAPLSVQATKRLALGMSGGSRAGDALHWRRSAEERAVIVESADAAEGVLAFAERREPRWLAR